MREPRHPAAPTRACREHLGLSRGVRDMVLAAHDMRDGHVDIVDHRGEQIEPGRPSARRTTESLIVFGSKRWGPPDQIVQAFDHGVMIEPEAPVRADTLGFPALALSASLSASAAPVIDRGAGRGRAAPCA